jgi:ParB family transcriptional regulator, chromosome partitioning protein
MTTTAAAENLAGQAAIGKKDEKVEKRRALGRGLESLLPGPRVVAGTESRVASGGPSSPGDAAGETKVSRFARDDSSAGTPASVEMEARRPEVSAPHEQIQHEVISIQAEAMPANMVANISIELIEKNPYQPRYVFDEDTLIELRDSIKEHGVVQPVVVRPAAEEGRYILVLGERRLRASRMAGKETVPALVRRLSPQQAAEMTVLENVVREDLNPIEQANAYKILSQEFKLTQVQIAQRIGVSRETVANYMRLLRLPGKVMEYVAHGRLTFSEARELLALENPEHILLLAEEVLITHPTLEQIGERVRTFNDLPAIPVPAVAKQGAARWVDPNVRAAQMDMERTLGMRVRIRDRNGKGKIVIEYASVDDYERVVEMLRAKK